VRDFFKLTNASKPKPLKTKNYHEKGKKGKHEIRRFSNIDN
jgi:hypothetical protein